MTDVFVIRNQLGHYWGKSRAWVDGSEARAVMRAKHQDEAINTLFELSSKDIDLRGEVIAAELSQRGEPVIESSQIPLVLEAETEAETGTTEPEDSPTDEVAATEPDAPAEPTAPTAQSV